MDSTDLEVIDLEKGFNSVDTNRWKCKESVKNCEKNKDANVVGPESKKRSIETFRNVKLSMYAHDFVENLTLHGVRYIFQRNSSVKRRFIWLCLVLTAYSYTCYVSIINMNHYLTYPSITKTKILYEKRAKFPAVTVCNYNVFQRSSLTPNESTLIQQMYEPYELFVNYSAINITKYDHVNMTYLLHHKTFNYFNNMGFCLYQKGPCNISNYYTKIRDVGKCLTFDPSNNEDDAYQSISGNEGGLDFGFLLNETEWIDGPFMNFDGMVIAVHDPSSETVMVENFGTNVPVGHTVNIILSRREEEILAPPHGQCGYRPLEYHKEYSQIACQIECEMKHMIKNCHCKREYMPGNDTVPVCTPPRLHVCKWQYFSGGSFDIAECNCPPDCKKTHYDVKMTVARITEGTRQFVIEHYDGFDILRNGVQIRVYYSSMSYKSSKQEQAYSFEQLLCNTGGAGGLFLGASFMSFAEFLDFLFFIGWYLSVKFWKRRKNVIEVLPTP